MVYFLSVLFISLFSSFLHILLLSCFSFLFSSFSFYNSFAQVRIYSLISTFLVFLPIIAYVVSKTIENLLWTNTSRLGEEYNFVPQEIFNSVEGAEAQKRNSMNFYIPWTINHTANKWRPLPLWPLYHPFNILGRNLAEASWTLLCDSWWNLVLMSHRLHPGLFCKETCGPCTRKGPDADLLSLLLITAAHAVRPTSPEWRVSKVSQSVVLGHLHQNPWNSCSSLDSWVSPQTDWFLYFSPWRILRHAEIATAIG